MSKNQKVKKNNERGLKAFFKGFTHAFDGIINSVKSERNLRIHLIFMIYVYIFSLFYNFSRLEYILLIIICGLVVFSEIVNTAIEALSDAVTKKYNPYIKLAKDAGAGAVLVLAVTAVACGVFLFFDIDTFKKIFLYFKEYPLMILLLVISIVLSLIFINGKKNWQED